MEFDGKAVADSQDLPRMVASTPVGKSVNIKLWRNEKALDRQVKVGEMEETVEVTKILPTTKPWVYLCRTSPRQWPSACG